MSELFYILTTIYVAYVICTVINDQKTTANSPYSQSKTVADIKPSASRAAPQNEKVAEVKAVAAATTKLEPVASSHEEGKEGLKDPATGEVVTAYSNYRFTKRWIKEALASEGLLDKVYKNEELNAELEAKIKSAILKLEVMDKYRA